MPLRFSPRLGKFFHDEMQRLRGWDYRLALKELEELQWASAVRVSEYRTAKLRRLLAHCARNVPFYEAEFESRGLEPDDNRPEEQLRELPVIRKATLRADYERFFATDRERPSDAWTSSGSTGEPFTFRLDRHSIAANTFAALARGRRWWGFDHGVREGMIWSGVRDTSGTLSGRVAALKRRVSWGMKNICLVDVYDLDHDTIRHAYERLRRFQPVVMRAISSGLYRFCSGLEKMGLDGAELGVQGAIFTGEALPATQRRLVERVLQCPTISEYGCTELGIIGFECPDGGFHLNHENLLVEYLKDGRDAEPGEESELVLTNLNDYVAPLVRYAVGDLVVPSDAACPCGRRLPVIESVEGRTHDQVVTPKGSVIHGLFFTHLFDRYPVVHQFRVVQKRINSICIELTSDALVPPETKESIQSSIAHVMGEGVAVEVEQVDALPVAMSGKTPWIISELEDSA